MTDDRSLLEEEHILLHEACITLYWLTHLYAYAYAYGLAPPRLPSHSICAMNPSSHYWTAIRLEARPTTVHACASRS